MSQCNRMVVFIVLASAGVAAANRWPDDRPPPGRNADAVARVKSGSLTVADPTWWGFDEEDSTPFLQAAIDSGAATVVVPNVEKDWVVTPIKLRGNQELILDKGVVVVAKRGAFRGRGDCVFRAVGQENLTVRGYGATIRMQKQDYISGLVLKDLGWNRWVGPYDKAEWRSVLSFNGCSNVRVLGLELRDSGGDGIYVAGAKKEPCRNVLIKDVVCDNNYRQGISVISVDGLLVENSTFKNTWGTPPSAGVDIEPDDENEKAKNIVFRDCRFDNNYGDGIEIFLSHLTAKSDPVSILFESCRVGGRLGSGIRVSKVYENGPAGTIEFRKCLVEDTDGHGWKVQDKNVGRAVVRFVHCTLRNTANNRKYASAWTPIWLQNNTPAKTGKFGGVEFVDCFVDDRWDRPVAWMQQEKAEHKGVDRIVGDIIVRNPHGARLDLGPNATNVTLKTSLAPALATAPTGTVKHVKVYYEPGRFGGWPANHGIWVWGNEILVGFSRGYYKDLGAFRHNIDRQKPEEHWLARSKDGGETWALEYPAKKGALIPAGDMLHGAPPPGFKEKGWRECPGGIDFTHPDFAMTVRMTTVDSGPSRFYYSLDRGHSWEGPFGLPLFGTPGIAARTDYVVNGKHDCMLFLTAAKKNGKEGRPLCVRTQDGGKTWQFVSFIGDEPAGYSIMPATVRVGPKELLTAIRCRNGPRTWLESFRSVDDGAHWQLEPSPAPDMGEGNPAAAVKLADGRIFLAYGHRAAPYAMKARLSSDGGHTWGKEIVLRADGSGRDIGYPRAVQRADGKVVVVYYFMDAATGPERYIGATIWSP